MGNTRLNALIRSSERGGMARAIDMAAIYYVVKVRWKHDLHFRTPNQCTAEAARDKLIRWAKDEGYAPIYDQGNDTYTFKIRSVTFMVDKVTCTVKELQSYYKGTISYLLNNVIVEKLEAFLLEIPKFIDNIKEDEQYIVENYERVLEEKHRRKKLCTLKQTGIGVLISQELDNSGYKYRLRKDGMKVIVTIDTGNYILDYPINNSKVTKMNDVILELRSIISVVKALPQGVRFRTKRE